jgi:DNA-binding CsgD family transcriptional regulator
VRGSSRLSTSPFASPEPPATLLGIGAVSNDVGNDAQLIAVLEELRTGLRADNVVAYRPEIYDAGWDLELACWVGRDAAERERAHRLFVQRSDPDEPTFAAYDPFSVQSVQQNRALDTRRLFALETGAKSRHDKLYAALKSQQTQQVRVLICEGPRLLAWLGALREEPFREDEVELLQRSVEPLRRHFSVQRQLARRGMQRGLLESLLDALDQPAVFFSARGVVEFENLRARELLAQPGGRELFGSLRRAVVARRAHPAFTLAPLRGFPGYTLALYTRHHKLLTGALEKARTLWQLTARQTSFLEHLAHGLSNKEIAARVGCAEVTVEKQLTHMYRTSGARSRTELLARLHAL